MPALASAVLAATDPEATQPSKPSFSMTKRNMSIDDFGSSSSRTAGNRDCWIKTDTERSSASSCTCQNRRVFRTLIFKRTYPHRCSPFSTRERRELDLNVQLSFLMVCRAFRLPRTIPIHVYDENPQLIRCSSNTDTAHAIFVFSVSM